jgi:D-lactate dehydrogenase
MKIVLFEVAESERLICDQLAADHTVVSTAEPLGQSSQPAFQDAEVISTFIDSQLTAETLAPFRNLRLIAARSTGYDHIDLDYCRAAGITVCNVPDYGDTTVAEHAFALLLALSRRIPAAVERTQRGDFSQDDLRGFDLSSKILGVVGVGGIGWRVIHIAKGFGMGVIAFDVNPDHALESALGFRFAELNEVLTSCDVLTLHVPGGAETHHLISTEQFALMKPSAVLVNTSRGGVVDAEALIVALTEGRLSGAALDVLGEESWLGDEAQIFREGPDLSLQTLRGLAADHALMRFPNVILTPHIAYNTHEAVRRILDTTLANIQAFVHGEPQNVVGEAVD